MLVSGGGEETTDSRRMPTGVTEPFKLVGPTRWSGGQDPEAGVGSTTSIDVMHNVTTEYDYEPEDVSE